ncbi:MAG: serine hydrolase domain-containing protein [Planctomycetota bacterium]|nr:serine hydrolase domain-containing protein [Planctomycetota bacterium]
MTQRLMSVLLFLSITAPLPAQIEGLLELQKNLINKEVTGSNVALVVRNGEVIHRKVVNSGKKGDKDITDDTLFPIWSMSKPITIVAMMTLHEKGLFDWNDPVEKYMPCFTNLTVRDGDTVRPAKEVLRVVHLMTHRSGYTYYGFMAPPDYTSAQPNQTRYQDLQQYVEVVAKVPLAFEPGTQYAYGVNQAILGRLVEVLSGKSFAGYLEEALFEPLGMSNTGFVLDEESRGRIQPLFYNDGNIKGFTSGLLDSLSYHPDNKAHFGGEGLISTLEDYSFFCEMLVNGGNFRGKQIINADSIATMTRAWTPEQPNDPGYHYGFSIFVLSAPEKDNPDVPAGIYGWAGWHNTHFWIDPKTKLYGLFMSRAREFKGQIPRQMREAIYSQ